MSGTPWIESDTERALRFWEAYQRQHDVSDRIGQTAGVDPLSGQIWFGASAKDIVGQMDAEGVTTPLYFVRVGADHYLQKGKHR